MFGLSLFRPSRQSNISTSGEERFKYPLPRENKINQMPYPIPTPGTTKTIKSPPHAPPPPPTPAGFTLIGALVYPPVGAVPQLISALLLILPAEIESVSVASRNFPTFFVRCSWFCSILLKISCIVR